MWTDGTVGGHPASTVETRDLVPTRNKNGISFILLTATADRSRDDGGEPILVVHLAKLLHRTRPWKLGIPSLPGR